jgi:hypothetical protein
MNTKDTLLIISALCMALPAQGESAWGYVPSMLGARPPASIAIPDLPTEAVVRIVGSGPPATGSAAESRRVFAVDIYSGQRAFSDGRPPAEKAACTVPEGARWPDSSGRIVAVLPEQDSPPASAGIRNPWEVHIHAKPAGNDTMFTCGGLVAGGEGGPIAILNGRVVRKGEALGGFRVAGILADCVLLGSNGIIFVLPMGKSTIVTMVGG